MKIVNKKDNIIDPSNMVIGSCYSVKYNGAAEPVIALYCCDRDHLIEDYNSKEEVLLCDLVYGEMILVDMGEITECKVLNAELTIM